LDKCNICSKTDSIFLSKNLWYFFWKHITLRTATKQAGYLCVQPKRRETECSIAREQPQWKWQKHRQNC
jgi:hypothetical protein